MTVLIVPLPSQSRTFTATTFASLATPTVRPAATDATCVPWPSQSDAFQLLLPPEKSHLPPVVALTTVLCTIFAEIRSLNDEAVKLPHICMLSRVSIGQSGGRDSQGGWADP